MDIKYNNTILYEWDNVSTSKAPAYMKLSFAVGKNRWHIVLFQS